MGHLTFKEKASRGTLQLRLNILFNQADINLVNKDVVKIYERSIGQVITFAGKVNYFLIKKIGVRRHIYVAHKI